MEILESKHLNAPSALPALQFASTADLVSGKPSEHAWVAQSAAKEAALFGLKIPQAGFNVLVLGEHGSGRTSLMHSAMLEVAASQAAQPLHDWVAVYAFEQSDQPTLIKLPVGQGVQFRSEMETFVRGLMQALPQCINAANNQLMLDKAQDWLEKALQQITCAAQPAFKHYLSCLKRDVLAYLKAWQPAATLEADNSLEGLLNESFLARFRVNLLVDHQPTQAQALQQPVVYDNDPSYQSLFGWLEGAADAAQPDFLRLRAGNLHKADGGMLLIHLRDLLNDEQNGNQNLEKLYRFVRNGTLQFEDLAGGAQSSGAVLANTVMPVRVKLVLIAMREDFYNVLEEHPDFFDYFPIKVEFADSINAQASNYAAIAGFVAQKCLQHQCPHFSNQAVASLIGALQRLEEDQARISTNFAFLERLMLESAAYAGGKLVQAAHVQQAIQARNKRRQYFETQIRDSIIDNELLIQVDGAVVGQINGLTHIELGDASFGSPIRITARCYPGQKGLINIDREVNMSGPNHDKGIFILQNWLSASFSNLAPLSLNASLVFEQEYNGVEGDSASCAELFALLSALANLPLQQGIAITGALNQFGEVMPIGGINEKIDGYFRVCQALGLNGQQGVIIPKRNQRHLLLDDEVVQAVKAGLFKVITIDHVLEGIAYLTGIAAGTQDAEGNYAANTVMGHAQTVLANYRKTLESNQPSQKSALHD